ncbi:hypothetical protein PR003_g32154 [Phytophthora rubi]|uniref:Uncharacterized protein n=1 Tax=Phytophthora rubi TaxID=129364 RepID=A0A6A3KUY6_9STRA|nr:hypothetical protein PR001_g16124 [Phytophthora rubi]KAE9266350.1 hypothetical protein PR003_g32154 [Phytophthora rubi]
MEDPIDWKDDINQIVADTVESTWVYPTGFREAFERKRNTDGTTPQVRVCGSEFHEAHANLHSGMGREMAEDDVKLSLQAADVVIIDEMHLSAADRQQFIDVVTSDWAKVGSEGAVITVKLSCRDKARALKLNKQSRRPLPTAIVEVLFQQFATDIGTEVPTFTVESFAQPE